MPARTAPNSPVLLNPEVRCALGLTGDIGQFLFDGVEQAPPGRARRVGLAAFRDSGADEIRQMPIIFLSVLAGAVEHQLARGIRE